MPRIPVGGAVLAAALFAISPALAAEPDGLTLPPGFHAEVVADGLAGARHIAVRANGDIYISTNTPRGQQPLGMLEHRATGGGGLDTAGTANQQWFADFFLQRLDLLTDGRLGKMALRCGGGQRAGFDDAYQKLKLAKFHGAIRNSNSSVFNVRFLK